MKGSAKDILERMKIAYGAESNTALSRLTNTPASTISNWLARESIPFRYVFECARVTGKDIEWILNGNLENASFGVADTSKKSPETSIYNQIVESGGLPVLQRILRAYGFTMQKQLGDLLGISSGTMSTWVRRNFFPGDVVVTCALDTGVSLEWLATGKGAMRSTANKDKGSLITHLELFAGKITEKGQLLIDKKLLPENLSYPVFLSGPKMDWIIDRDRNEIVSGTLLLNIDGELDVYNVSKKPGNKITICNVDNGVDFTCGSDDVSSEGRIMLTLVSNV
ncbi:MAG: helix-turn-helix domain-containing protein [Enterobacteriaceae bacterium]|nr:helix-turn-helix domain-containing protein [Enterobacteriaceae bacterium]